MTHKSLTLKKLLRSEDGNFALLVAVVTPLLAGGASLAVDVTKAMSVDSHIQDALDATIIATAAKGTSADETFYTNFFKAQMNGGSDQHANDGSGSKEGASSPRVSLQNIKITFNTDNTISGDVRVAMKTSFGWIFGMNKIDISASSQASLVKETKLRTATFRVDSAQGAFDKDIYFFTRDANGKIIKEELALMYDYNGKKKAYYPSPPTSATIKVGEYATYGFKVRVYKDYKYKGARVNPVDYYSDAPDAWKFLYTQRDCTNALGSKNYFEDGGDSNYMDFVYSVKCDYQTTATGKVVFMR